MTPAPSTQETAGPSGSGALALIRRELAASLLMRTGLFGLILVFSTALIGPLLISHDPDTIDLSARLSGPTLRHWLGTDELGRDILARVLSGARISLTLGVSIALISCVLGTITGCYVGLRGGWLDTVAMRAVDILLSLPGLVLAMAFTAALGPSLTNATLALTLITTPGLIRLARGQALMLRNEPYVEASLLYGGSRWHVMITHVIPNAAPAIIVQTTLSVGAIILAAAALSFLGLGAQPPTAEWGAMVASGRNFLTIQPLYPLAPGLAILVTAVSFNLLGDGLNDALNPRREGQL